MRSRNGSLDDDLNTNTNYLEKRVSPDREAR